MKKVKMMLLSIAILAVVGAALAFKANFGEQYCYTFPITTIPQGPLTCPAIVESCDDTQITTIPNNPTSILCITPQVEVDCSLQDDCTFYASVQENH